MINDTKKWLVIVKTTSPGFYADIEDRDSYGPYSKKWIAHLFGLLLSINTCHIKREYWVTEDLKPLPNPFRKRHR